MNGTGSSTDTDPDALKRLQEQTKILQANLDFYKLTHAEEQEKLKAEIDRVKLEADKQKAEADKIKALLPSGTTKPLSGETKTDEKFGYLAKLAVNEAVKAAAEEIAKQVRDGVGSESCSHRARGHAGFLWRRYPGAPDIAADGCLEKTMTDQADKNREVVAISPAGRADRQGIAPCRCGSASGTQPGVGQRARDDQLGGGHRRILPG